MATVPNYLSIDQFRRRYSHQKPHFEYWFGEAVQKRMPTLIHSILQGLIFAFLREAGWIAGTELRLKLSKVAEPVPDVAASSTHLESPYPTKHVELCVEILSPGDTLDELFKKAAHYLDWGVGWVWIIDGEKRRAFIMSLDHPEPLEIGIEGALSAGTAAKPAIIPMQGLFENLDTDLAGKTE